MKLSLCAVLAMTGMAALCFAPTAHAQTVVTFDDFSGQGTVPDGYGGITWYGNWTYYDSVQTPYTPESAPERVYDGFGSGGPFPAALGDSFTLDTPSVFDGAYFAGYSNATVTFDLYDGTNLVATSGTLSPSSTPTFLASGYSGLVTTVVVSSPSPDFFVMDNVTYTSAVPEPGTYALLGSMGLTGAAFLRRRRTR